MGPCGPLGPVAAQSIPRSGTRASLRTPSRPHPPLEVALRGIDCATTGGGGRSAPDPHAYQAEGLSLGVKLGELRLRYFGGEFAHDDHGQDLVGGYVGLVDGADQAAVEHDADAVGQVE